MKEETIYKIKKNKVVYSYLREHSYEYQKLYREDDYYKELEEKAKEYYKERPIDKIERLKNQLELINTFMSVIE